LKTRKLLGVDDLNFEGSGVVPVVVQDQESLKVLTLAYVDREALQKTLDTGYAHYFRRSLRRVMMKGETSGNVQEIKEIRVDCDYDSVLYIVKPRGPACHLGEETCFHNKVGE